MSRTTGLSHQNKPEDKDDPRTDHRFSQREHDTLALQSSTGWQEPLAVGQWRGI